MYVCLKGGSISQLEKEIGPENFPSTERYCGLVNVSESGLVILTNMLFDGIY